MNSVGVSNVPPQPLQLTCNAPLTTVLLRDVPLGHVVRPAGAHYAIAHDSHGLFAFSTLASDGACELDCANNDAFRDPCHLGVWDVDGTLLQSSPNDTQDLTHLAVHVDGSCDMSVVLVDGYPNEFAVDPTTRVSVQ